MENTKRVSFDIETNIGKIPIEDFLHIKSVQYGFDSYSDLWNQGFRIPGYENISPKMLLA